MKMIQLQPTIHDKNKRIDCFISEHVDSLTRSAAQRMISEQQVLCDNQPIKKNYRVIGDESITLMLSDAKSIEISPQNIPIDIVYEDSDIIIVNKCRGMVVHPAAGNWDGTLVNALMYHCGESLSGINGVIRPGIVHRIDKDTSGLLVVAKNNIAHQSLAAQIAAHTAKREYEAVVIGTMKETEGSIVKPIGRHRVDRKKMAIDPNGKPACTLFYVIKQYSGYAHMRFRLQTGRTHQIRVHMASIGHPIIGDIVYGLKSDRYMRLNGQCLHAAQLTLEHPSSHETMQFTAPLPDYFCQVLADLDKRA